MKNVGGGRRERYCLAAAGNVVAMRRLVWKNKICVPRAITAYCIREHHECVAHVWQEELPLELPRHHKLATRGMVLKDLVDRLVLHVCIVPSVGAAGELDLAVNLAVGDHVALDSFQMMRGPQ